MPIIAVDFDGTLTTDPNSFPAKGEPNWKVINKVKQLKKDGWELILWTCRTGDNLTTAIQATREWGIEWDAINTSAPSTLAWWGSDGGRKIFANVYLDDRAIHVGDFMNED